MSNVTLSSFRRRFIGLTILATAWSPDCPAQDQLRGWGVREAVDTEAFRVPLLRVSTVPSRALTLALTTTHELLAFGDNSADMALPPPAPPGQHYVNAWAGEVPIAELSNGQLVQWSNFSIGSTPPTGGALIAARATVAERSQHPNPGLRIALRRGHHVLGHHKSGPGSGPHVARGVAFQIGHGLLGVCGRAHLRRDNPCVGKQPSWHTHSTGPANGSDVRLS
jgi:hypothetical protein